jgi:alkylhydroperoxidase/carboxymuconolactone decarboxylase family protein YurZ
MTATGTNDDVGAITERLAAVRAERGYLLPHHGLLAVAAPDLLAAYAETYRAMTLRRRTLDNHAKEFVWLAILVATDEAEATHHLAKFAAAGGTAAGIEAAVRLTAIARGSAAYRFVDTAWQPHLPAWDGRRSQAEARADVARAFAVDPALVVLADAATRVCLGQWRELGWAIEDAYAAGVPEAALAEALMLTMFPAGVPSFVKASAVWLDLIRAGTVAASPAFRAWADIGGQGGYDEAAGKHPATGHAGGQETTR